jgi:hypothetical protein
MRKRMNIQLAIVRACLGDGCRVRLLESGAVIDVRRDSRSVNRDRLRYGYLAAVDLENEPAIVWHWQRAQALIWRPNAVLAVLPEGRLAECQPAPSLPADIGAAPEVWVSLVGDAWEVHDAVLHGHPAHPERLIAWVLDQQVAEHA